MAESGEKYRIAVIDDEKELAGAIKDFLESRNFVVEMAYNGRAGLELVLKEKPDLVILDVMMPLMDGRDVLSAIKREETTKHIPVLMLTAKDDQFDRDHGLELGAYEYITKPYDSIILLRQVNNILSKTSSGGV